MSVVIETEPIRCTGSSCGLWFEVEEGWSGLCPSCVASSEEHLNGEHGAGPEGAGTDGCPHCC